MSFINNKNYSRVAPQRPGTSSISITQDSEPPSYETAVNDVNNLNDINPNI